MTATEASAGETLFSDLAEECLLQPEVTQSTMMGYPCLRINGAFFACVERGSGHLVVKLPASRVADLVGTGNALPFAPNGRTFREWAAFTVAGPDEWRALIGEARAFVAGNRGGAVARPERTVLINGPARWGCAGR